MFKSILTPMVILCTAFLSCTLAFSQAHPHQVSDSPDIQLVRQYLSYMDGQQLDQAKAMMHPEITFDDPTWGNAAVQGADAVVAAYQGNMPDNLLLREQLAFSTNNIVVIQYMGSADLKTPSGDENQAPVTVHVMAPLVRVIGIKDGKIISHIDLAEYDHIKKRTTEVQAALSSQ